MWMDADARVPRSMATPRPDARMHHAPEILQFNCDHKALGSSGKSACPPRCWSTHQCSCYRASGKAQASSADLIKTLATESYYRHVFRPGRRSVVLAETAAPRHRTPASLHLLSLLCLGFAVPTADRLCAHREHRLLSDAARSVAGACAPREIRGALQSPFAASRPDRGVHGNPPGNVNLCVVFSYPCGCTNGSV